MPLVIDASVALCWALADERHAIAEDAFERMRSDSAVVPVLWWFELRNALIVNERRRRISERDVSDFLRQISVLRITLDALPSGSDVLALSRKHRLTVYDATYLELSSRGNLPLATLDSELADAARAEKLSLIGQ